MLCAHLACIASHLWTSEDSTLQGVIVAGAFLIRAHVIALRISLSTARMRFLVLSELPVESMLAKLSDGVANLAMPKWCVSPAPRVPVSALAARHGPPLEAMRPL